MKAVLAHDDGVHAPTKLPACTSRGLTCELPSELAAQANLPLETRNCIDGAGAAVDCADVAPFGYFELAWPLLSAANQADWVDAKVTAAAAQMEPLFATPCSNGLAGEFPCSNIDLQAFLPLSMFPNAAAGNDDWGWTDPDTGTEYVLMGLNSGTAFVDIRNPEAPVIVGVLPTHTVSSSWRDIKVYADHAFVVADLSSDHGLQVFDLTQLRNVNMQDMPVTFKETAYYNEFGDAHNIAINEQSGFAYAVGSDTCRGGLHMINIQDPLHPQFAGCYADDGYTHDARCVIYHGPDLVYNDREICFNSNEDTVTIVDVSDKAAPQLLSRVATAENHYVHQGWLTEDQRYFLQDDELDELLDSHNTRTYMWDVADLDAPKLVGMYTSALTSTDHNLYVRGSHVFEANYTSGLRVLDLAGLPNGELKEAAYFDTEPTNDNVRTRSAWNVYPYFKSGSVAVSTITEGLFILKPNLPPEFTLNSADNLIAVCREGGAEIPFETELTVAYLNDYNGPPPMVAIADAPAGIGSSLVEQPAANSLLDVKQATYKLSAQIPMTATGAFPVRVAATADAVQKEAQVIFFAATAAPAAVAPESGTAILPESKGVFVWQAAEQGLTYEFELAADSAFSQIFDMIRTTKTNLTVTAQFAAQSEYFWRVRAVNPCGLGPYSEPQSIRTDGSKIFLPIMKQ
ncbi:MAG: choice-of-anchor B family protein [Caldilineaceae bacterium]